MRHFLNHAYTHTHTHTIIVALLIDIILTTRGTQIKKAEIHYHLFHENAITKAVL